MLKKTKLFITTLSVIVTGLFIMPSAVIAGPFDASQQQACKGAGLGSGGCGGAPGTTLTDRIKTIVNILSTIVGIAAVIMVIIGGFRYITAAGDSSSISGAKNTIIYALVGLVIAVLAQVIVRFVLGRI